MKDIIQKQISHCKPHHKSCLMGFAVGRNGKENYNPMKTLEKLIKQFNRKFPHHTAYLDRMESYSGNYHICITDEEFRISSWYYFRSCAEFSEWMKGVILE